MVQVTGISKTPLGVPNAGEKIRFTCIESTLSVNRGTTGVVTTGGDGSYNFKLLAGIYSVEVQQVNSFEWKDNGKVEVSGEMPSPMTLVDLVNHYQYIPPEEITDGNLQ